MDKIRIREFKGSVIILSLLALSCIGIPAAIVYLINNTVETEFEVEDAHAFWESHDMKRRWSYKLGRKMAK